MIATEHRSKLARILLLSLAALLLSMITLTPPFAAFELKAYDLLSRTFNPAQGHQDIILVQVDQPSLDSLAAEGITWPWPRQIYAPLFERLAQADAVFVDILFTEPSSYGDEDDLVLAEVINKSGNITLPVFVTANTRVLDKAGETFLKRLAVHEVEIPSLSLPYAITPIAPFASAAHGGGNVMIKPDRDGVYRRTPLLFQAAGLTLPNFVLGYALERKTITIRNGALYRENTPLPTDNGALLVRFPGGAKPYETVAAIDLISEAGKARYQADYFKGRKVFIGLTAAGLYDLKPTAVSAVTSGMMVHAVTLDALLNGLYLQRIPNSAVLLFMVLIVLLVCSYILTHTTVRENFSAARYHKWVDAC